MSLKKQTAFLILSGILALPALAGAGAGSAAPSAPSLPSANAAARLSVAGSPLVSNIERRVLTGNIAEYSFQVRVGPGPYDVVGLHRVVRETAPFVPIQARQAVFFAHGDIWDFRAAFLTAEASPALPDTQALPVFLARNGVDVWGIDFRWTRVPGNLSDYSFMTGWGIETDARDLGIGIGVARVVRGLTGIGAAKVILLGWSRGGQIAYTYLNAEASRPAAQRRVKGFIPADIYIKSDVPAFVQAACTRLAQQQQQLAQGVFADTTGQVISTLGNLAAANPNGLSPIIPNLTNRQAALLAGEATFNFQGGLEPAPFYHLTGGTFDINGVPAGLSFTADALFLDQLRGGSPFEPVKLIADAEAVMCDQAALPFVDNLAGVTVPVFYLGADGGFGTFGLYGTTLLGSADRDSLVVDLEQDRLLDFGHADLFLGTDAPALVWQPLLDWLHGVRTQ